MSLKEKIDSLNFSSGQKKMLGILLGLLLVFIVIIIIVSLAGNSKVSYEQLENIMTRAAENYAKSNSLYKEEELYGNKEIKVSTLIEKGYMKPMVKYLGEGVTCDASVIVYKNLDRYTYIPKLKCSDDYKTVSLKDAIIDNNVVSEGSGLYEMEDKYVYRGEYVDNYVTYSGATWRIISIDETGIKMIQEKETGYSIWDNRYNADYGYAGGINSFEGVEPSRLKNSIMEMYNNEKAVTEQAKAIIVPRQYCVGKRSKDETVLNDSVECETLSELMGATTLNVGEYLTASLDEGCTSLSSRACVNYNYLARLGSTYWTTTAPTENTGYAYMISSTVQSQQASMSYALRLVVTVNGEINYKSGTGTMADPYIID